MDKWFIGKKYLTTAKYITFIEAMKAGKSLDDICKMLILDPEYAKEEYAKAMPRVKLEMNIDMRRRGKRICFGSKQEPYYDKDFDEMDAWAMPEYKYEELSSSERDFYEKTEDA